MTAPADRLAALDDYVTGQMRDEEAARFEEALFDAPDDDAVFADELARLVTIMARSPAWDGGRRRHVDELRAAGLNVHYRDLGPAGAPASLEAWEAGTQVVVIRLGVDLRGYDAADVEVETADGRPIKTFRDVSPDPDDGAIYAVCQEPLARLLFRQQRIVSRVVATRGGRRETVAVFDVTPTL
jgi:hypothetical protein